MYTRRIDDLGRIVIPKEIRLRLKIEEGDPLDLNLNGETIVVKKHYDDKLDELQTNIALLADVELRDKLWNVFDDHIKAKKGE